MNLFPAQPGEPFDAKEAWQIVLHGLKSNPRSYNNYLTNKTGYGFEPTPLEDLISSSALLDYVRQHLPENVSKTGLGRFLEAEKPQWVANSTVADKIHQMVQGMPLGGYSYSAKRARHEARARNEEVLRNTVELGRVQRDDDPLNPYPMGDRGRLRAAQATGAVLGDFLQQGIPYIYWGLNAAPALTAFATLQATHRAGNELQDTPVPLLKRRAGRMLLTAPAWIGMNLATGQFGRTPGYTAASPSATDPTVASDPLSEVVSRVLLGRSGNLLPYDEFVKERPDVSRSEYEAYKAYLFGNKSPLKATLDGIHGPEVTFVGKSIPLATGILPAVAMAVGARAGAKRAARRLANSVDGNLLDQRQAAYKEYQALGGGGVSEKHSQDVAAKRRIEEATDDSAAALRKAAFEEYSRLDRMIENETLRQAIGIGSGAMTATALTGATLEALRRAIKGRAPLEEEIDPEAPVAGPAPPL